MARRNQRTDISASHCGRVWVLIAGSTQMLEEIETEKKIWSGKYFRCRFDKVIKLDLYTFFFLEHSLPHSYIH